MLFLSSKWANELLSQPETGMGYQIVSVYLRDGRSFHRVRVVQGCISRIDGGTSIPFVEADIDRIVVTHDRS